jgi:hypothetical protein
VKGEHRVVISDVFDLTPDRLMLLALFVILGLVGLFALAVLARMWGAKIRRGGGAAKGLNLENIRRQLLAGEINEEEYQAIARHLAGQQPSIAAPPVTPIKDEGSPGPDAGAEGSRTNGQE